MATARNASDTPSVQIIPPVPSVAKLAKTAHTALAANRPVTRLGLILAAGLAFGLAPISFGQDRAAGATAANGPAGATATSAPAQPPAAAAGLPTLNDVLRSMTAEERAYHQHVATLANPFFEGRAPGLRGNALAAEYVEFFFRRAGLEPLFAPKDASATAAPAATAGAKPPAKIFRQTFPWGGDVKLVTQTARVAGEALEAGKDFAAMGVSASAKVEGQAVFVGYSINRGEGEYATYAENVDLKGKIAVMLRFEPKDAQGKSQWAREGQTWSNMSSLLPKIRRATDRGAIGVIVIHPPGVADPLGGTVEAFQAPSGMGGGRATVPVVMLSAAQATQLIAAGGHDLTALTLAADKAGGVTELGNVKVALEVETKREPWMTDNVAGVLRGRGALADEYIVIGGHYDHVGYGDFGSRDRNGRGKLHPGADDNASGTAGVILAAERMTRLYRELPEGIERRSIIFIAFTAEESGLNGARYFVQNSPVPAGKIYAMLNMDMIGRVRNNRVDAAGVGTAEGFEDLLTPIFERSGLEVRKLPGGRGPSDHAVFFGADIPVVHFFTGLTREYHMPTDTYDTINAKGAVQVMNLCVDLAQTLAQRSEVLTFRKPSGPSIDMSDPDEKPAPRPAPEGNTTQPPRAEPTKTGGATSGAGAGAGQGQAGAAGDQQAGTGMTGVRVRFGIAPGNYGDDRPGIEVADVTDDTPAKKAGIKVGDRLTKWNGQAIRSVEDWMPMLGRAKPGDVVTVVVQRNGQDLELKVTLEARETREPR